MSNPIQYCNTTNSLLQILKRAKSLQKSPSSSFLYIKYSTSSELTGLNPSHVSATKKRYQLSLLFFFFNVFQLKTDTTFTPLFLPVRQPPPGYRAAIQNPKLQIIFIFNTVNCTHTAPAGDGRGWGWRGGRHWGRGRVACLDQAGSCVEFRERWGGFCHTQDAEKSGY